MCGRFTSKFTWKELHQRLRDFLGEIVAEPGIEEQPARFNIAPTQPIAVVLREADLNKIRLMRWGLVPHWVKDPREFPLIINARSETITSKPAFRGSLRHHRCVVPASGYYEWKTGAGGKKQPYYITRADRQPLWFAGVYSGWQGPDGEEIETAAIATVPAEGEMKSLHDRIPAVLEDHQVAAWLDVRHVAEKEAVSMLRTPAGGILRYHPVSTRVGSVANDDEGLIAEVAVTRPEPPAKKTASAKKAASGQMDLF